MVPIKPPDGAARVDEPHSQEVIQEIAESSNSRLAYRALVRGSFELGSNKDPVRYAISCRPEGFRVELLAPNTAYTLAILGVVGSSYRFVDLSNGETSQGTADREAMMKLLRMPLDPNEVCYILFGQLAPSRIAELKSGQFEIWRLPQDSTVVFLFYPRGNDYFEVQSTGALLTRSVIGDRFNQLPRLDVRYQRDQASGTLQGVEVQLPQDGAKLHLKVAAISMGSKLLPSELMP